MLQQHEHLGVLGGSSSVATDTVCDGDFTPAAVRGVDTHAGQRGDDGTGIPGIAGVVGRGESGAEHRDGETERQDDWQDSLTLLFHVLTISFLFNFCPEFSDHSETAHTAILTLLSDD